MPAQAFLKVPAILRSVAGSINVTPSRDGAELGYWLDVRYTGKGYATLAAQAMAAHAKTMYTKVYAVVAEGNDASSRVLERAGFKPFAKEAASILFDFTEETKLWPDPDIAQQLDDAFKTPLLDLKDKPKTSQKDLVDRSQYFSPKASIPESMKIRSYESPAEAYSASTGDASKYGLLLAQAMQKLEIVKGRDDPSLIITPKLEKVAWHERQHGAMASVFGVGSRYGVRVLHDPDENIWAISPYHALAGNAAGIILLTRLEEAAIAAAPDDASSADLHTVRSLGYADRVEVLQKLQTMLPDLCIEV